MTMMAMVTMNPILNRETSVGGFKDSLGETDLDALIQMAMGHLIHQTLEHLGNGMLGMERISGPMMERSGRIRTEMVMEITHQISQPFPTNSHQIHQQLMTPMVTVIPIIGHHWITKPIGVDWCLTIVQMLLEIQPHP